MFAFTPPSLAHKYYGRPYIALISSPDHRIFDNRETPTDQGVLCFVVSCAYSWDITNTHKQWKTS